MIIQLLLEDQSLIQIYLLNKATGIVNGEIGEIAIAGAGVFGLSKPTRAY
jgi:hypothetical protein